MRTIGTHRGLGVSFSISLSMADSFVFPFLSLLFLFAFIAGGSGVYNDIAKVCRDSKECLSLDDFVNGKKQPIAVGDLR